MSKIMWSKRRLLVGEAIRGFPACVDCRYTERRVLAAHRDPRLVRAAVLDEHQLPSLPRVAQLFPGPGPPLRLGGRLERGKARAVVDKQSHNRGRDYSVGA